MAVKRVLIVDDERLARISLADFLQESGYEVIAVSDGESAIRQQQQQPFDVCIVDIRMPSMNGVETMLALHRAGPDSLYIVYTGSPQFVVSTHSCAVSLANSSTGRYKPTFGLWMANWVV